MSGETAEEAPQHGEWRLYRFCIYTHQRASKEGTSGKMNPGVMDRV
jgi:hypothetical protein